MLMSNSSNKNEIIRSIILELLRPRLSRSGFRSGVDASTQLLEVGLIDSKDLLDIILEVEERCAVKFDPEHMNFESGLTLGNLISAFATS